MHRPLRYKFWVEFPEGWKLVCYESRHVADEMYRDFLASGYNVCPYRIGAGPV